MREIAELRRGKGLSLRRARAARPKPRGGIAGLASRRSGTVELRQAIEMGARDAYVVTLRAYALIDLRRPIEAIGYCEEALALREDLAGPMSIGQQLSICSYLKADPVRVARWGKRLGGEGQRLRR